VNWGLLFPLLVTTVIAVAGWWVAHWTAAKRDQVNKRRDLRIQYLIDAYRKLESVSNRDESSPEWAEKLESAIADIQLFGSAGQVAMAKKFASDMAAERGASADDLLNDLRKDLRQELNLENVPGDVKILRIKVANQKH
jgi:hypothetical protein